MSENRHMRSYCACGGACFAASRDGTICNSIEHLDVSPSACGIPDAFISLPLEKKRRFHECGPLRYPIYLFYSSLAVMYWDTSYFFNKKKIAVNLH